MSGTFISVSREVVLHAEDEAAPLASFDLHKGEASCAVFNHNAHVFASGGADGLVQLYHIEKRFSMMSLGEDDSPVS